MLVIRGCPYVCTFCDQAATTARRRSPPKVIEEIKEVDRGNMVSKKLLFGMTQ